MKPISIQFPADLFIDFASRVAGDPSEEIAHLVRKHLADLDLRVVEVDTFKKVVSPTFNDGDPDGGIDWSPLWLPNGTDLRMRYRQKTFLGKVRFDAISFGGQEYNSVSQWVRHVARGTSRNAWHDVWIKFVDSDEFMYADALRQVPRTGIPANGETPEQRIRRLGAIAIADFEDRDQPEEEYSEE